MTNDKDLFNSIDELFEDLTVDEASKLIGEELQPSQEDYENELIEKLNNNDIQFSDEVVQEIRNNIEQGGDIDIKLTHMLREQVGLTEIGSVEPEDFQPEQYKRKEYIDEGTVPDVVEKAEEIEVVEDERLGKFGYISNIASNLSTHLRKRNEDVITNDEVEESIVFERVKALETQLNMLRNTLREGTMVSGIGQGGDGSTPGGGETKLKGLDDVEMDNIKPGQTLCWDPSLNSGTGGFYPCDAGPGGGGTLQPPFQGCIVGCKNIAVCGDLAWGPKSVAEAYTPGDTTPSGVTIIQRDVKKISELIAFEYQPEPNGNVTCFDWVVVGLEACDGTIISDTTVRIDGESGPNDSIDAKCLFFVYSDPTACLDNLEGCDEIPVEIFDCAAAADPGGKLRWGEEGTDGEQLMLPGGIPITGVTKILAATFEGCDTVSRKGRYTVYYSVFGAADVRKHTLIDTSVNAPLKGFFIDALTCDDSTTTPGDGIPEFCEITPCNRTINGCPLVFSDGVNESAVVDENGVPIINAVEIYSAFSFNTGGLSGTTGDYYVIYREESLAGVQGAIKVGTITSVCDPLHPTLIGTCDSNVCDHDIYFGQLIECHKLDSVSGELVWDPTGNDDPLQLIGCGVQAKEVLATFTIDTCTNPNFDITRPQDWFALYKDDQDRFQIYGKQNGRSPEGGYKIDVPAGVNCSTDKPDQPIKPGPLPYVTFGCQEHSECGQLYFGTPTDYSNGPTYGIPLGIEAKSIENVVVTNVYDNTYTTFNVIYQKCGSNTYEVYEYSNHAILDEEPRSFYIQPDAVNYPNSTCTSTGESGDPYQGLIVGCKETDNGGLLHWGTESEAIDQAFDPVPLKDSNGDDILCKGIIAVYSLDAVDPGDGDPGRVGTWHIVYDSVNRTRNSVLVFGRSGPSGPQGAFVRPLDGSTCLDNTSDYVTTRDVILENSIRYESTRMHIMGDTNNIVYNTQEEANLLDLDILRHLHDSKPTIHLTTDINDEIDQKGYIPQTGDLWVDPTDYSIYVCHYKKYLADPRLLQGNQDEYMLWVEINGGGSGNNAIQSNITLSDFAPVSPSKHGDLWIDAETYIVYTYKSETDTWVAVTGDMSAILNSKFEVGISPVPPQNPKAGDMWFDDEVAELRMFYYPYKDRTTGERYQSGVWVPVTGSGYKAVPTVTRGSVDATSLDEVSQLKAELTRLNERIALLESQP